MFKTVYHMMLTCLGSILMESLNNFSFLPYSVSSKIPTLVPTPRKDNTFFTALRSGNGEKVLNTRKLVSLFPELPCASGREGSQSIY
jgi:hypothetical protein